MRIRVAHVEIILVAAVAVCAVSVADAAVLRQLTKTEVETFSAETYYSNFAIDDAGTFVVTASTENEGGNLNNDPRLVGWTLPAGSRAEIVPFPVLIGNISVSDDGQWTTFVSAANPVGQNSDGSVEAFLVSRDGTTIRQLTHRPSFAAPNPRPVLSGSANRVLFIDTGDLLGTNPAGLPQLFVIDTTGLNLRQLTAATDPAKSFCAPFVPSVPTHSVDDAGRRVVFAHNGNLTGANASGKCQLFRIGTDGNLLTQITAGSDDRFWPVLSGDGTKAAYWIEATGTIHVVDYQTAVSTPLIAGVDPSITDDGQWVYYADGDNQLFKIPASGGAATQVTVSPPYVDELEVAGSNAALAIGADGGALPGGSNPDESLELWVTDTNGTGAQQLTQNDAELWLSNSYYVDPDITPDGSRIAVIGFSEVYRVNADGSNYTRLSFPSVGETAAEHLSVGQDGDTIVFESWLLTPPLTNPEVFALRGNGTELFQLGSEQGVRPVLGKTSNLAVFQGVSAGSMFKVELDTPGATQFTMDGSNQLKFHRLDYDAEWVVYNSPANPLGTNPDGSLEIFRVRTDGSGLQQLTSAPSGISLSPDISADGSRVVFVSTTDPVGLNPDGNEEIFLIDVPTNVTQQLTDTTVAAPDGFPSMPRISGNGAYVFFELAAPFFEYPSALYRMDVATGRIERCDGIPYHPRGELVQYNSTAGLAVDYSGDRVAFVGWINGAGKNGDGSTELFLADFAATPQWEISGSQPTVLSWEPDPRGVRYDVMRGDLANLAPGPGGTVDLGPVVCLENDSADPTTIGFGDPAMPAPSQGFFFLYRFTQGAPDGPGSWGLGTGNAERIPGLGACAD